MSSASSASIMPTASQQDITEQMRLTMATKQGEKGQSREGTEGAVVHMDGKEGLPDTQEEKSSSK